MQVLVLASGSRYRAELLSRLKLPFSQYSPEVDETPQGDEKPVEMARRLARDKALTGTLERLDALMPNAQQAIVIASDQVAAMGSRILGKPGSILKAREQLIAMSGQAVNFHTALYLVNVATGEHFSAVNTTVATLRELTLDEIERYIAADQPLDCAGSFKVESLGISLFNTVETTDPTALVGLPMITLCEGLRTFGLPLP